MRPASLHPWVPPFSEKTQILRFIISYWDGDQRTEKESLPDSPDIVLTSFSPILSTRKGKVFYDCFSLPTPLRILFSAFTNWESPKPEVLQQILGTPQPKNSVGQRSEAPRPSSNRLLPLPTNQKEESTRRSDGSPSMHFSFLLTFSLFHSIPTSISKR